MITLQSWLHCRVDYITSNQMLRKLLGVG